MSRPHENHQPHELTPAEQAWEGEAVVSDQRAEPLAAIEQSLAALAPAPPRVDRDRLMFLAGAASATSDSRLPTPDPRPPTPDSRLPTPRAWLWPATSAALAATSLALAIALLARPTPAEKIVYRDRPIHVAVDAPPPASHPAPPTEPLLATAASHTVLPSVPAHNYLRTRDVALRHGLDALGTFPSAGGDDAPVPTYRSLLESLSPSRPRAPSEPPESTQM
jgi:hypothetical protein